MSSELQNQYKAIANEIPWDLVTRSGVIRLQLGDDLQSLHTLMRENPSLAVANEDVWRILQAIFYPLSPSQRSKRTDSTLISDPHPQKSTRVQLGRPPKY